jgi:HlyD family secretion protein
MKKLIVATLILAAGAAAGTYYYKLRASGTEPVITTVQLSRGDVVEAVGATGTLQAVTTVQVGTQVSGTIQALYADFNEIVRKGQLVARLDPSLFETQIEQARANLIRSEAETERLKVTLEDARTRLRRAEELAARNLIPRTELDSALVSVKAAEAQLRSADAQVVQARASLNQNEVNLRHTVIHAPIDGIVISRNVDVGQTVAASMQAPTLFVIAEDLTNMQVNATVDEADVGRIRPGQAVRFRVDAYPNDEFLGTVSQVRLQPVVVQNVVTYATVIDVPNPQLKLKPGMTANVNIEIARRENTLRISNAALRFRPTPEIYAALNMEPPAQQPGPGTVRAAAAPGAQGEPSSAGGPDGAQGDRPRRGEPGQGNADRRREMTERLQSMSPAERAQFAERMQGRGMGGGLGGRPEGVGSPRQAEAAADQPARLADRSGTDGHPARTIDSLFGPLPVTVTPGRAWVLEDGELKSVRLQLGISDGVQTEVIESEVDETAKLVSNILVATTQGGAAGRSPLMQQPGRGGFGGMPQRR